MSELQLYPVSDHWAENARINKEKYEDMYQESVESPDSFWGKASRRVFGLEREMGAGV